MCGSTYYKYVNCLAILYSMIPVQKKAWLMQSVMPILDLNLRLVDEIKTDVVFLCIVF